ncbi:MAG: ornithine carbamoyltransferase [Victivallales bacterium]|jgi:ornithine carbamoyltransferase|nr:ornithine carbamoyltransferase [Victivallales bacterium]
MKKDLLTLRDITRDDLSDIFELATKLKIERGKKVFTPLEGKSVGLIFAKSSTRTRVSFEVGVGELGGRPLYLDQGKMQIGRGETVADTAKVLSRYLHGIVIRTFSHAEVEELAREATIPVINALTDDFHPCQILADLLTIKEYSGKVDDTIKMAFYGDARSNIANSLILAARLTGMELVLCSPAEEQPDKSLYADASNIAWESDPMKAAENVDYFYTDVWVSMGLEEEKERRMKVFAPYQVNEKLFAKAKKNAKFLHCLPAHRGEEVSAGIMDDPERSIVFDEAENRLHVQKAVMSMLMK